ncbi:protein translocase subunit SecF [Nocardioides panacisoli]|uniref:protein translocase subunit SecF n=1 Tax=Nocardioides panacisoli TaxID=627624 RepID=UPI001C6285EA|nr:protein translocase subunit SecF [Nocardioides panacisoli]QYJ05221.1 protein translocase subunit SecF [Nocardioides panacisoli]
MGKMSRAGYDLYTGDRSFNFVGNRALWYGISLLVVGLAFAAVIIKPLNFGVEFVGGAEFTISPPASEVTQANADALREEVADSGIENAENPSVTTAGTALVLQTEAMDADQEAAVREVITGEFEGLTPQDVSLQEIGPSWGQEVANRALLGIAIFLTLVVLFIWAYFKEWKMSVAALAALFHDVAVTIGVYAISGFQVTPAAVTGVLAILGFSLYDTVVVFDKVRENTTKLRKNTQSYADAANLAVNQTVVRSINTSIVALLPIGGILLVSGLYLSTSSLQDLALAQFVGMAAGVYSSVMLAPRLLVHMKSGEAEVRDQERRARAKAKAIAADPYHSVPAFADDMAVGDGGSELSDDQDDDDSAREREPARRSTPHREDAVGKGRVVPESSRPVSESTSSGRQQPKRQPRSQRRK